MKYCLRCGKIYSNLYDNSRVENLNLCTHHDFSLTEDTEVSDEIFYNFSEEQKDAYEQKIYNICKQSEFFDENQYELMTKPYNYYYTYRFDKYEQLSGKKANTKENHDYHRMKAQIELEKLQPKIIQAQIDEANKQNLPKCPTCQSTNIRKIGGVERGISVGFFGLFSRKINKSFKCNNCGYTW